MSSQRRQKFSNVRYLFTLYFGKVKPVSKSELRIQYSGLIIFAAQLVSVVTGMAFILLLTRNMATNQYGVWSNIFDVTGYFLLFSGFVPFWATRFVARGEEGAAKTALLANLTVALASAAIYIPLAPIIAGSLHINETSVYVLASAQIVTVYAVNTLESCLRAKKPQAIGYGLLLEEAVKLSLAYLFIVRFHQLFIGAMLSLILSASFQTLFYMKLLSKDLRQKVQWSYVREWLKGSTAILYNAVGGQLANFVFILLIIYGTQSGRADYQAAATFATIIGYSSSLAFALYPKLLAENSLKEITASLKTVLMFALPLVAIVISMSPSLLTVLKISYREAWPLLIVLSIDALISLISTFYTNVIYGVERLDEEAKIPLRKLIRSKMFKLLTLPYVQAAITLPTALYILTQLVNGQAVQAATYVAIIIMAAHAVMLLLTYLIMGTSVRIVVPWRNIGKYVFASAVTAVILYVVPHPATLALTFVTVIVGAAIYAALLLAIDKDARMLVRSILQEIGLVPKTIG
jgi:O-antigen/teichoic acid export membrane protein